MFLLNEEISVKKRFFFLMNLIADMYVIDHSK